jgi:L-ribulose-5-phosphate 3-epimerase
MTYEDLMRIAVETGTDEIDKTVYWLPGTSDAISCPRRLAYRDHVEIYSIGTRVRLAQPTPALRQQQLDRLRKWLDVAQKLGATHVRVFSGDTPEGATLDQAIDYRHRLKEYAVKYSG